MRPLTAEHPAPEEGPDHGVPGAVVHDEAGELARVSQLLRSHYAGRDRIDVLEAGCGRQWKLDLGDLGTRITGVDIDPEVVRLRVSGPGDLADVHVADRREMSFHPSSFDLVYCSFVLEHLTGVETLMDRFVEWLRPGGLLVLRVPDRESVYGFVTRHTPHRLHVWYRRHILGMPDAGRPGHGPFPVVYEPVVSRRGLHRFCAQRPLALRAEWSSDVYLGRMGRYRPAAVALGRLLHLLSLRRLHDDHNNLAVVIEKPQRSAPASTPLSTALSSSQTLSVGRA